MTLPSTVLIRFMEVSMFSPGVLPAFESIADNDELFFFFWSFVVYWNFFTYLSYLNQFYGW